MKVLLDASVVIAALQSRIGSGKDAQDIFLAAAHDVFVGYITAKAATDIYHVMRNSDHSDKTSREALNKLFTLFEVLDTSAIDCRKAIPSPVSDFEDAVMIETALRSGMDCIVTRKAEDVSGSPVPVFSPKEFLFRLQMA